MKNRGICLGNIAFLGIISLLAGCDTGLSPENGSVPLVDKNGNYIITVNTAGMAARSITAADASLYAEEYEIVCYDGTNFYSGYTRGGNLTVALPEGTYDMLVLAGNGSRVLLGTGWQGDQPIGPETGSVTITVKPLTILESEMTFADNTSPTPVSGPPSGTPPTFGPVGVASNQLTTAFTLHNMEALETAAVKAGITPDIYTGTNGFAAIKVAMKYYDVDHFGTTIGADLDTATPAVNPVLTFDPLGYTAGGHWSAFVYLTIEYIPFSQSSAPGGSRKWYIMNGTGRNASNGAVKVTAGNGGNVLVNIFTNF
jgi:hypothetical protein